MKLSELYLGFNDGITEATEEKFTDYFYDHNKMIEKVLKKNIWLVLGRKGTGKSLLGRYLEEIKDNWNDFSILLSYQDFRLNKLVPLKSGDESPNQYIQIWKWLLLIEISRLLLQSNELMEEQDYYRLGAFFNKNFGDLQIDKNKILEITKNGKIKGEVGLAGLKIGGEIGKDIKYIEANYSEYLYDLEETVSRLLKKTKLNYLIMLDGLDHRFKRVNDYQDMATGIIYAAKYYNNFFSKNRIKTKILVFMRSDIFNWLNDPDLNKVKLDNTYEINWGEDTTFESPLFDLIIKKVERGKMLNILFPSDEKMTNPEYILTKTLLRPRDLITFLNLAKKYYPKETAFTPIVIRAVTNKYSEYFHGEFRNELSGHLKQKKIDKSFDFISKFARTEFNLQDALDFNVANYSDTERLDLRDIFSTLFDFSILGNSYFEQVENKVIRRWAHLEYNFGISKIEFDISIIVHPGLYSFLKLSKDKP